MKNLIASITMFALLLALLLAGCSLEAPSDPTGQVNDTNPTDAPTQYVAIGNSLTAGYMDTGLRKEGQKDSIARLIANQMGLTEDEFTQPYIDSPGIGTTQVEADSIAGSLYFNGYKITLQGKTHYSQVESLLLELYQPTQYHNLGVPGAWATDILSAYDKDSSFGSGNSYFNFINRVSLFGSVEDSAYYPVAPDIDKQVNFQTGSQFRQALAKGPRLLTLWIGGNDIYLGATSGNPNNLAEGGLPITPVSQFQESLTDMVALLAGGMAGRLGWDPETQTGSQPTIVMANLPELDQVPHFIPTALFEQFIEGIGAPVPGYDEGTVTYVLIPAISWVGSNPGQDLPSTYTLTPAEVGLIEAHVDGYNQVIAGVADIINGSGVAKVGMVDANQYIKDLPAVNKTWFLFLLDPHAPPWSAEEIETAAGTTFFSLDGFHPNNKGYAGITNEFIKMFNSLDGSSIPELDPASVTWDPTYGTVTAKSHGAPGVLMTPEAGRALAGMLK